jgi:hypothetical protein
MKNAASLVKSFDPTPTMDLDWKPILGGISLQIPEIVLPYDPAERERWLAAQDAWQRSNCTDYSVWGDYATLAQEGRLLLPDESTPEKRFAEFRAALSLQRAGLDCWGQVLLFKYGKHVVHGKGDALENTATVKGFNREWRWPTEIQHTLDFQPRNPDLVAYDQVHAEWRFCEVKEKDSVDSGQLAGLGVLHLLTGAPVAVVRLVPHGRSREPRSYHADVIFNADARVDWIRVLGPRRIS